MPRVIVLGSSGFDLTIRLARLPRPGETLLGGSLHTGPGGKGANAAIAARRADGYVTFLTAFGDDDFGRRVAENGRREGLDLAFAKTVSGEANQVALIFVSESGDNLIGVAPGASAALSPDDIDTLPADAFPPGGVFLASLEVPVETVAHGLRRARDAGMTTILNPAPADSAILDRSILALVDVLTPNEEEAHALTGVDLSTSDGPLDAARSLRARGANAVVLTLGSAGCLVLDGEEDFRESSFRVQVVDSVGAGDAFNGALAVALSEGMPLRSAARFANAAGALAVTRTGAQGALPRREEIERLRGG